jgi:hypothetical protein
VSTQPADSFKKTSSNHLNRQIGLYSLAAAAAGVSVLALSHPAAGEVVVTRKTIPIPLVPADMLHPVKISLANNGIDDFGFNLTVASANGTEPDFFRSVTFYGLNAGNSLLGTSTFSAFALALPRGAKIGPSDAGASGSFLPIGAVIEQSLGVTGRGFKGHWGGNPKNRYLGVRFLIDGQTHYGWVRLTVTTNPNLHGQYMSAKITAYAYETEANKPILAGTTESSTADLAVPENIQNPTGPSLGMLAAGADALPLWRREHISISN